MEFKLPFWLQFPSEAASIFALLLFLYAAVRWRIKTSAKRKPPQPSRSWPVIGHLHLLRELPHHSLGKLSDKYGSIFLIKVGVQQALVVSSAEMAKECLVTNDRVFVNRPQTLFVEHLAYNSAMVAFSPYGPYWREMRKIITVELLSNHRLEMLKHVRISEVRSATKAIHGRPNSEPVEMKKWFNDISLNTIVRIIVGKSLYEFYQDEKYDRISKALEDFFEFAGAFVTADVLPILRWLDIGGYEKNMKKVANEIDHVAQEWLEAHKLRRVSGDAHGNQDFMDFMIDLLETVENKPSEHDADKIIKATSLQMILAAADTTALTLTWALSLLLNNKNALKKAQAELDTNVGNERQINESDLKSLVYLQAIVKETLRLYPAGPLSVPREAVADCTVAGYDISAGTQLFVNLYKLHRDPKVWSDPLAFRPERFLTTHKDYDVRGQNFEYLPFGSGRRICPGISFALQFMHFALASVLQGFEICTPLDNTVDMSESFGLSNHKATPLDVVFTPRLPEHAY